MPLEIRELNIKVNVNDKQGASADASQPPAPANGSPGKGTDKDTLISECVDEVMRLLNHKKER